MKIRNLLFRNAFLMVLFFVSLSSLAQDLVITTAVCGPANSVRLTGPFWGWDPNAGPVATNNGNGTWTFTLSPAPSANMEYLLVVDGVQENLIQDMVNGGSCAPITDYANYANRIWYTTDPLSITNTYDQCGPCSVQNLTITTAVCSPANSVRLTGPFWGWDPNAGPVATNNGNGTWTFTLSPAPTANMEYLLVVDGVQENLIQDMVNGGTCAPVTDYANYANRIWNTTDPLTITNTFDQCGPCALDPTLAITIDVCSNTAQEVRITGPFWNWDPNGGPVATNNGNGTWTVNLTPPPTAPMEYLVIVDGVQENLIQDMLDGGTCAPVTDYFSYANRVWMPSTDPLDLFISYDRCVPCSYPNLTITTEVCDPAQTVKITGPLWNWSLQYGKTGVNNGDGTWTFTFNPAPTDTLEYLINVDGTLEDLVGEMASGASCAPITDYSSYANRRWTLTDNPVVNNTYNTCASCTNSLNENALLNVNVYPNPVQSELIITDNANLERFEILNIQGKVVMASSKMDKIDVSNIEAGVYFITMYASNQQKTISFIKN